MVRNLWAVRIVGVQILIKWVGFELDAEDDENWLHAEAECAEKLVEFLAKTYL